jgi:hypothetical protein
VPLWSAADPAALRAVRAAAESAALLTGTFVEMQAG